MSVWADIHNRSLGKQIRKEDQVKVEERSENLWQIDFSDAMERLKKEQIKLNKSVSDLRRELDKFRWDKNRNYIKCNYKR